MATTLCRKTQHKKQRVRMLLLTLLAVLGITAPHIVPSTVTAAGLHPENSDLIVNGGYLVRSDTKTISYRTRDTFLPASTLKLLTSLAALDLLTPDFRFETRFYLDGKENLYIQGYGDPFLTSEEISRICSILKTRGVSRVNTIILDDSSYCLEDKTPGTTNSNNPYDAPNGALAVNFNTLAIDKLADGTILSAEPQTPTLPLMQRLGKNLPGGVQRINITNTKDIGQIPTQLQYVGQLFCAKMNQAGITVKGGYLSHPVPPSLHPTYIHKNSKNLSEVIKECLHYSNNFIANQVFLYLGQQTAGTPANWVKGRKFITNYLTKTLKISAKDIYIQDGSGLSRHNRISAEALVTILEHFRPYHSLLNRQDGAVLKTGTLQGVYCYGGYFTTTEELVPFAILLNQKENTRAKLLTRLQALYSSQQ